MKTTSIAWLGSIALTGTLSASDVHEEVGKPRVIPDPVSITETESPDPKTPPASTKDPVSENAPALPAVKNSLDGDTSDCPVPRDARVYGPQFWGSADYLMWWLRGQPRPGPLLTTGPDTDPFPGALDQPNTRILHGNSVESLGLTNGMRIRLGGWLDSDQDFGFELGGFLTEQASRNFIFGDGSGTGADFLARPFVNDRSGAPNVYFVSQNFPNPALAAFLTGTIDYQYQSRFWGYEANALINLHRSCDQNLIGIFGFRGLGLDESFMTVEHLRNLVVGGGLFFNSNPVAPSQIAVITDRFLAENRFYGANAGVRYGRTIGRCLIDGYATVGIGVTHQTVIVDGNSVLLDANGNTIATGNGGVLAQGSNIGRYERSAFSVVPEIGVNMGYQLTSNIIARFGYSFMYWTSVARPTRQLDFNIDPGQVPTDAAFGTPGANRRPELLMRSTDFWAQGINFGIEFRR